jgi:hypothetical protein
MFARFLVTFVLTVSVGLGQQKPDFAGDYSGAVGPLHVKLHIIAGRDGTFTGTVDSPDQGLTGIPCADVQINGQSLSFTVPMVHGTWVGFMSADGASLTGMWSQGSPMPLNFTRTAATANTPAPAGIPPPQAGNSEVKWDDYTFKFDRSGTMAQVFEGSKVVGTILTMNGQQQVIPLPGTDSDKLKKSFDDYKAFTARSHAGSNSTGTPTAPAQTEQQPGVPTGTTPTSPPAGATGTAGAGIVFDDVAHTITVPRPQGVVVTFAGEDVKIARFHKVNYVVRHQKGNVGRFLESNVVHANRVGSSLSGGGEEFLLEGGGLIYDSGMGGVNVQESHQVLLAKQLSQIAVDAVADVRQVPGHESFSPPGYSSLKEISQYRLRSDGSR